MRKKYKKNLLISLMPTLWLFFLVQQHDMFEATKLTTVASIIICLSAVAISVVKKRIKKRQYLSSSLYYIDKMNPYEFEVLVGAHFDKLGYRVRQTPKSGDYGVDLLLEKNGDKIAVQVKRYSGKVGNKAVQEVVAGMHYYKCNRGMVVTNSYYTLQAEKMAKECDVELWNRDKLKRDFKIMEK